jgi:hypothetical protein
MKLDIADLRVETRDPSVTAIGADTLNMQSCGKPSCSDPYVC